MSFSPVLVYECHYFLSALFVKIVIEASKTKGGLRDIKFCFQHPPTSKKKTQE